MVLQILAWAGGGVVYLVTACCLYIYAGDWLVKYKLTSKGDLGPSCAFWPITGVILAAKWGGLGILLVVLGPFALLGDWAHKKKLERDARLATYSLPPPIPEVEAALREQPEPDYRSTSCKYCGKNPH